MNILLGHPIRVSTPEGTREMNIAVRPADHAAEWGFVLQYSDTIERFAHRMCVDDRLHPDELRQEAIEWIVRLHGSFDPNRSAASSWIYFMVRRARQAMLERMNRIRENEVQVDIKAEYGAPGYAPEATDGGYAATRMEHVSMLSRVFERATAAEREAWVTLDPDRTNALRVVGRTKRRRPTLSMPVPLAS